ncbi:PAS domain-containing sensor histidine kinase [Clostridium thermosuccinogenes]|uniref:histidine kinase n=1 Tax=Clostridium thermosuccinogenes TaxID=84032 RepID=A0A2K2F950_9CLOT|nr:ATP-binding protein [Pseudoclostridium thermosuccinogenes]AUS98906.1 PAS domain-containing sensor histidine kinase [Pseudoclostridium thermosuccinogenes]PNT95322.1 PAS domain-containing sensor histidine kinase [Pseudoclostridium thermosuccinogenes]PNT96234.1 PAS domain-containing sensor histidine kinase [Pseudoclostridium thermosuccinogenes]
MRFFKSLQWRLVFIFIAMDICVIIPISLLLKFQVETSYYEAFKEDIERGSQAWNIKPGSSLHDIMYDLSLEGNKNVYLFNIYSKNKTYTIYDKSTNTMMSTDKRFEMNQDKFELEVLNSSNFVSALAGNPGNRRNMMRSDGEAFFDYALLKGDFIIYFRYYSDDWAGIIEEFNNIILNVAFIAVIASLIIGYILSKTITIPIADIMQKARAIAEGEFGRVLEVRSDDEIGDLTKTFNYMSSELKNTLIEISSEKSKIETILKNMTDGIIAFNIKGEIIHINPAAKVILGENELSMNFNEFSDKYGLNISLEDIIYLQISTAEEKSVFINDKYIRIYFATFTDDNKKAEGVIAVLQDVTEMQKLDNMRKEFVANVSHEMRTPLTSIKSYAETLLDGAYKDSETAVKFLTVINSEADRMTRLVKDLLQLSRLDNHQMQWNMQQFSFTELVRNSIVKLQIEAENKNQKIESYIMGDIPEIKGDRDRIEQVVLNILTNAIKYTPEGGKITVYVSRIFNDVTLKVADTGIGIPRKDLSRIFERFYRVDKARSREMGGTGLGLSIAKEIVEAHGGTITAESELGKGTEITVKLPI